MKHVSALKSVIRHCKNTHTQCNNSGTFGSGLFILLRLLLLLLLALQPPMGFILLSNSLPLCSFLTLLSLPFYFYQDGTAVPSSSSSQAVSKPV
jgi:hypothetical protein